MAIGKNSMFRFTDDGGIMASEQGITLHGHPSPSSKCKPIFYQSKVANVRCKVVISYFWCSGVDRNEKSVRPFNDQIWSFQNLFAVDSAPGQLSVTMGDVDMGGNRICLVESCYTTQLSEA